MSNAAGGQGIPSEWYFITPPQEVAWTKEGQYSQIDTYGTNQPYLQYGMTGLRQLNLGNAMIEGFSAGKTVETNILQLEACMRMIVNPSGGFTSPFCWKVFAGTKSYGTFIITNVSIRETMRDVAGDATRAFADITLHEVSEYQVESGIDLASRATYTTNPLPAKDQENTVAADKAGGPTAEDRARFEQLVKDGMDEKDAANLVTEEKGLLKEQEAPKGAEQTTPDKGAELERGDFKGSLVEGAKGGFDAFKNWSDTTAGRK